MGTLILTVADQRRADILTHLVAGRTTVELAAIRLGVTERQVRRLRAAFIEDGLPSVPHANRGRKPVHTMNDELVDRIWNLSESGEHYKGFNTCHLSHCLAKNEGIVVGRSTLQRMLQQRRTPKAEKQEPKSLGRSRRLRSAYPGQMVQIDGSLHDWLEGRDAKMCLMGGIDDATSNVVHLRFWRTETAAGYLHMFRDIAINFGLPLSYYHDKHTILRSPKKATIEEELAGIKPMSHVQKVLHDLGVTSIAAHSPQAKGRIERLWQTLQDRLLKEMRLARVSTIDEANAFLPEFITDFNSLFSVEPANTETEWVEMLPGADLNYMFSMQETRTVKADHTLSFDGQTLQIKSSSRTRSLSGQTVSVRTNPEGQLFLYDGKKSLQWSPVTESPKTQQGADKPVKVASVQLSDTQTATRPSSAQRAFMFAKP